MKMPTAVEESSTADSKPDGMAMESEDSSSLDGLKWKDNVGYLPDSDLKFRRNEFDLLELISDDTNSPSCSQSPFINIPEGFVNRFQPGMKLEAIVSPNTKDFSVVTIGATNGLRVRIHQDGYAVKFDYWTNAYSPYLKPVGYCQSHEKHLKPPRGFDSSSFSWTGYQQMTNSCAAPVHCFHERKAKHSVSAAKVQVGMKLMARWYNNSSNTANRGSATIGDILDDDLMFILFDNESGKDFWAALDSPFIEPSDLACPDAVPQEAFVKRGALQFSDSTLECADPKRSGYILTGRLLRHDGNRLLLSVNDTQLWVPEDSDTIFPAGFCGRTNFNPAKVEAVAQMWDVEKAKPLLQAELIGLKPIADSASRPPSLEPELMETGDENSCQGRFDFDEVPDGEVAEPNVKRKRKRRKFALSMPAKGRKSSKSTGKPISSVPVEVNENQGEPTVSDTLAAAVHKSVFGCDMWVPESAVSPCWEKLLPSTLIPHAAGLKVEDVRRWTVEKVADFVRSLPGCTAEHANLFQAEMIDGEALLLLKQTDITDILNFKLGPALKIYNSILYFNENSN